MENIYDMKLSQNGRYILANRMVYDISLDESVSINDFSGVFLKNPSILLLISFSVSIVFVNK